MIIQFDYMASDQRTKTAKIDADRKDLCVFHQQTHEGDKKFYLQNVKIFIMRDEIRINAKCVMINEEEKNHNITITITDHSFTISAGWPAKKTYQLPKFPDPTTTFTRLKREITAWIALPEPVIPPAPAKPAGLIRPAHSIDSRKLFVK